MKNRMRVIAMSVVAIALIAGTGTAVAKKGNAPHWVRQYSGTGRALSSISCPNIAECWAAGAKETLIRTVNGGKTWKQVHNPFGVANENFSAIKCPAPGTCTVVSPPKSIFSITHGGASWRKVNFALSPNIAGFGPIACPTIHVCYVATEPSPPPSNWFGYSGGMLRTGDGGKSWKNQSIPLIVPCPGDCSDIGYALQWISCTGASTCRAGGASFIGSHEGYSAVTIATGNGKTWAVRSSGFAPTVATCPTTTICTGLYSQPGTPDAGPDLLRSLDAGKTWKSQGVKHPFAAVACTGGSICSLAGPGGILAQTQGMALFNQKSHTKKNLNGVAMPAKTVVYAVGDGGTILKRTE